MNNIKLTALPCICVDVFDGIEVIRPGGEAVNFAVHASRFTNIDVTLLGVVGKDKYAEAIMDSISKLDIDKYIDYFNEIYNIVQAISSRRSVSKFNIACISDGLGRKRNLPFKDKIIIVDKSVTGIYERRTCFELENGGNSKSC